MSFLPLGPNGFFKFHFIHIDPLTSWRLLAWHKAWFQLSPLLQFSCISSPCHSADGEEMYEDWIWPKSNRCQVQNSDRLSRSRFESPLCPHCHQPASSQHSLLNCQVAKRERPHLFRLFSDAAVLSRAEVLQAPSYLDLQIPCPTAAMGSSP